MPWPRWPWEYPGLLFPLPADSAPANSDEIALSVYRADDPAIAVAKLSESERELFQQRMSQWTSVDIVGPTVQRQPSSKEISEVSPHVTTACYSRAYTKKWYDVLINTGDTWMTLNWCIDVMRGTMVSSSLTNVGGRGYLGITYEGQGSQYWDRKSSGVMVAQQFRFSIWVLGAQPCMKRGQAPGGELIPPDPNGCTVP